MEFPIYKRFGWAKMYLKLNLLVDVKEARTGHVSFGGGYSSVLSAASEIRCKSDNNKDHKAEAEAC